MTSKIAERTAHGRRGVVEAFRQPARDGSVVRQANPAKGQLAKPPLIEQIHDRPGVSVVQPWQRYNQSNSGLVCEVNDLFGLGGSRRQSLSVTMCFPSLRGTQHDRVMVARRGSDGNRVDVVAGEQLFKIINEGGLVAIGSCFATGRIVIPDSDELGV
jgi:hypothetical protein